MGTGDTSSATCPDDDTLAAIGSLPEAERAAVVDHAATCDACRSIVYGLLGLDFERSLANAETLAASSPAASPSPDSGIPSTIDRYRIDRRIGAGAMGVVYSGYDPELARAVAIKVLRRGGSPDRMKREAQALAQLAHPNVVAVYDVGEQDGATFVAMALVDGDNLRAWLQTPRTTAEILDAIAQAARGLQVAHAAGIVHRDIKPDNIFVAKSGAVLVGDFGLARTTDEVSEAVEPGLLASSELTRTGAIVGTPAYMAPEQAVGEAIAATDQFALCVTAWEALYGKRPFAGRDLEELVDAVRAGPPPPPRTRSVPSHVRAAIVRGLAADPKERHPSMAAFIAALTARRRWPLVAAGMAALATVGVVAAAFALRSTAADPTAACERITKPAGWTIPSGMRPAVDETLTRILDRYASDWQDLAKSTCIASARREISEPAYAATTRCLDDRRDTLFWILEQPGDVPALAESLEPIETCRNLAAAAAPSAELASLRRDLARATVFVHHAPEKPANLDELLARATQLDDQTAIAEASYLIGLSRHAQNVDPGDVLQSAITAAERAGSARIRTRASALLAIVKARKSLLSEAIVFRDAALSAVSNANDPVTMVAVERANIELAFRRREFDAELAAYRRIEAIQIERFGELSGALVDIRFKLAPTLLRLGNPDEAKRTMDLAIEGTKQLVGESFNAALQAKILTERNPVVRLPMQEQIVTIARRHDDRDALVKELAALGYDYEIVGDYDRALATTREVIALSSPPSEITLENGARYAFDIADRTTDEVVRKRHVDDGLAFLEQLPTAAKTRDNIRALRGRLLLLAGRPVDAIPDLTKALAASEANEPQVPFHIMIRSFALAQALWESGGARDRERAIALAAQAERRIPEVRKEMEAFQEGALLARLEELRARIEAWRRTHR